MEADATHCTPWSFFRPPHWRWGRAAHLMATNRRKNPKMDDEWVVFARRAIKHPGSRDPRVRAIHAARAIWESNDRRRWELEALLLTDAPVEQIAERIGLSAAVVEAYERVFFAARDEGRATDWLLRAAVGYSAWVGFTAELPAAAWRYAAHAGGVNLLDLVMAVTEDRPLPDGLFASHGAARVVQELKLRIHVRLWLLLQTVHTDAAVAKLVRVRRKLDSVAGRGPGGGDPVLALHEKFLLLLPKARRRASAAIREKRRESGGAQSQSGESKSAASTTRTEDDIAPRPRKSPPTVKHAKKEGPTSPSRTRIPPTGDSELATKPAPNPRRAAAGKKNRAKRKGLTPEGRQRLRDLAIENKPWAKSTGPKTAAGKAQAAANGKRRQADRLSVRELRSKLAAIGELVRALVIDRRRTRSC